MNDLDELIASGKTVAVFFYNAQTRSCIIMNRSVDEARDVLGDTAPIVKVDVYLEEELAVRHHVSHIPMLYIFKNGSLAHRWPGTINAHHIVKMIREFL